MGGTEEQRAALDAYIKLWRASHAVEVRAKLRLSEYGLTLSQFSVTEARYRVGRVSQRAVARKILRSSGNLTLVIDNLERDGLVRRERDTRDRRVYTVHLTDAGRDLIARVLKPHVQGIVEVFAALNAEELAHLAGLTRKLGLSLMDDVQP